MTLWFVLGTAAELIKMYPVLLEADRRGLKWYGLNSGQSPINLSKQWSDLKLPADKLLTTVLTTNDLKHSGSALKWFFRALFYPKQKLKSIFNFSDKDIIFVHGDTLTTLIGAIWSKKLRLKLAHVEAGMRSGHLLEPFPEEICRRIVSHMAYYHFAPYQHAVNNLAKEKHSGKIVSTGANTLLDAIRLVLQNFPAPKENVTGKVLVNLHRFENLNNQTRWNKIMQTLRTASKKYKLVFVMHPPTRHKLDQNPSLQRELEGLGIEFKDRVPFSQFAHWLEQCDFLITDGGSNQQESSYIGKPCLLMRDKTESIEGIGTNCILSRFNEIAISQFLENPEKYRIKTISDAIQPTKVIYDYLMAEGG
jgi:UDP-N-acetylglucosamine 2-epimerase (non-hydrolysing)